MSEYPFDDINVCPKCGKITKSKPDKCEQCRLLRENQHLFDIWMYGYTAALAASYMREDCKMSAADCDARQCGSRVVQTFMEMKHGEGE